jgi:hypothetical protein
MRSFDGRGRRDLDVHVEDRPGVVKEKIAEQDTVHCEAAWFIASKKTEGGEASGK